MQEISKELNSYINSLVKKSNLDRVTTEKVVTTQLALMMADLAVTGKSDSYLGEFIFKEGEIHIKASDLIKDLCKGIVDPSLILKEIFEHV